LPAEASGFDAGHEHPKRGAAVRAKENGRSQLALLHDDELAVLNGIKTKLNSGLDDALRQRLARSAGFVW